jgi:hypothetical protein
MHPYQPPKRPSHGKRPSSLKLAGIGLSAAAAVAALAGCAHSGAAAAASPAAGTTTSPAPVTESPAPAEALTGAAAGQAAVTYFDLYAAGQYGAAYSLLSPHARKVISAHVWAGVHAECKPAAANLAYKVTHPILAGSTAVVTVSLAGTLSKLASAEETFTYSGGRWWYSPSDLSDYHATTAASVAALKAAGLC